jgi:hypothetical protein
MIDTVSNLVELVRIDTKLRLTLPRNMHRSGSHDIRGQHAASMKMKKRLLDQSSNSYQKVVESKKIQPLAKPAN